MGLIPSLGRGIYKFILYLNSVKVSNINIYNTWNNWGYTIDSDRKLY